MNFSYILMILLVLFSVCASIYSIVELQKLKTFNEDFKNFEKNFNMIMEQMSKPLVIPEIPGIPKEN